VLGEDVVGTRDEQKLLAALRAGDEAAFTSLVARFGPAMLRVARRYVSSRSVAEEVVQEAWLGVLRGLATFQGRSSLKTWLFRILTNTAISRAEREGRTIPFSSLPGAHDDRPEPAVDPGRFRDEGRWSGHWASPPKPWGPEGSLLAGEIKEVVDRAIGELPAAQAIVITMRDIEGFGSAEVCNALTISESNQRVLLHRARAKVRRAIEDYMR
jgi:RNA polymerase sigma-70 factor (ECF subfamily)